ncbi:transcription antitermination factor NusB [Thalassospira alkalitolerans]|uniref:Transcription antitermination protein NusB n=1 Tax=Thalassospira alkalitolerans TaxID=1293890 RepID=A0A1Y2LCP0_9PROT|nr:transcription antitermination factor NusB [Thalassospira alkalitolerans]OSQ48664.1 antitermination protein NusB [Thalassospira alkalitolerans]|tara:strand:+ start:120074 stop:120571 length:498 start_codon:yes stop_codon:yes gene_type:complete
MTDKPKSSAAQRRSAARFAAIQALYQAELSQLPADDIVREFSDFRLDGEGIRDLDEPNDNLIDPDRGFFADLVQGVTTRVVDLDGLINSALEKDWTSKRLETVLRSILRAGTYELMMREDVPMRVVITEYVDAAHSFFDENEPKLVNAVLDRIGKTLRAGEIGQK